MDASWRPAWVEVRSAGLLEEMVCHVEYRLCSEAHQRVKGWSEKSRGVPEEQLRGGSRGRRCVRQSVATHAPPPPPYHTYFRDLFSLERVQARTARGRKQVPHQLLGHTCL